MRGISITIGPSLGDDKEQSDYRAVPNSDDGSYSDQGMLGSYSPSEKPFATPADVKFADGYGATEEDLRRGYCEPTIRDDPAYSLGNYKSRSSDPMEKNELRQDWEFRERNRRSKGFLTRPNIYNRGS